ncbi:hypothetical protein [Streptomyces litchfieldiae]|uniref:Uncharacterized protein n=1 Tax=Streptomyces litchfieldiae TaxID=3075543 RepID=A0ABU2MX14_9ACTN|nr:hypothetical protein [Streptomyces sp. DSM 44938]MDT0346187.1 hypothetical protein [Streptomyces sp. DSM 44938]
MSVQTTTRTPAVLAGSAEHAAMTALIAEPEAPVSGAPVWSPQAAGVLLALILLSPKQPTEPRDK